MIEYSDIQHYDREDLLRIIENIHYIVEEGESHENWERIKAELNMEHE